MCQETRFAKQGHYGWAVRREIGSHGCRWGWDSQCLHCMDLQREGLMGFCRWTWDWRRRETSSTTRRLMDLLRNIKFMGLDGILLWVLRELAHIIASHLSHWIVVGIRAGPLWLKKDVAAIFRKGTKVNLRNCRLVSCNLVSEKLWSKSAWKPFLGIWRWK